MTDDEILDFLTDVADFLKYGWSTELIVENMRDEAKVLARAIAELEERKCARAEDRRVLGKLRGEESK